MSLLHQYVRFLALILYFEDILCFCENSHVIICDDLADITNKKNDTTSWKYLQIGSAEYRNELPNEVFGSNIIFNLPRTKSLTIMGRVNFIKTPFSLVYVSEINYLNLYANNIIEVDDYSFGNSKSLREVYLKNNKIQHLGRGVFINTTLEIVDLSRNQIRSITTCFYSSKIKWILLNHNKISFIKSEAFPNDLEQLELNNNLLESLEDNVFRNLKNLKELYLKHNFLTTIPNIVALQNIVYLHFGYNKIQEVHYRFDGHRKLEFVDLTSNSIRNITADVFAAPKLPPLVLLPLNRLTNMVFQHPEKKTDFFIYGNPWNCDCLFHIERTMQNYHHMKSCDIKPFDKGRVPLCIENGKCENANIGKAEIDRFLEVVRVCEEEFEECIFRL